MREGTSYQPLCPVAPSRQGRANPVLKELELPIRHVQRFHRSFTSTNVMNPGQRQQLAFQTTPFSRTPKRADDHGPNSGDDAQSQTMFRKDLIDVLLGNPISLTQIVRQVDE